MTNYRTVDCETWARRFIARANRKGFPVLIEIKPKPPGRLLGGIRMPDGVAYPNPGWHYHFAVLHDGKIHDEAYPNGLPPAEYKARFEYQDAIDFIEHRP